MLIIDPEVTYLTERLREHYRNNIANRFIRPALLLLPLDQQAWELIDSLMESDEGFKAHGYQLVELYQQLAVLAKFIHLSKHELSPMLRIRLGLLEQQHNDTRVLREMAINNFLPNINVLADIVNDLYLALIKIDLNNADQRGPLYLRMPELQDFSSLITE